MFDTHCHLDSFYNSSTDTQSPSFIQHSSNQFLAVSSQLNDWLPLLKYSSKYKNVIPALGIHPWFVSQTYPATLSILAELLSQSKVSVLGEIGLDFGKSYKHNKVQQLDCFEQQLNIAKQHSCSVSLHCVKAHNEMLQLLKLYNVKGVVHGIGSSVEVAQQYINLGFKLGVNGVAVKQNAVRYHKLITHFGLEHLVLETDYPNVLLANTDVADLGDINQVALKVSQLLSVSIKDVVQQTDYNAQQIFKRNK